MGIAFLMVQGCVTADSVGNSAHHKGPFGYQPQMTKKVKTVTPYNDTDPLNDPLVTPTSFSDDPVTPAPTPKYTSTNNTSGQADTYIVKKGDILSRLAVRFHTTTKELVSLNNLSNPNALYVGQELQIPQSKSTRSHTTGGGIQRGQKYEIRKGDTLSKIAVSANVSIDDLRRLNNIKNDRIFAGEILYIPKGGKTPKRTSSPKRRTSQPKVTEPKILAPQPTSIAPPPTKNSVTGAIREVEVMPGDTLASIAKRNNVSKSQIMSLNGISNEYDIKDGQRLRIPIQE
jgi:LysM repeat protein